MSLVHRWLGKFRRHRSRLIKFGVIGILGLIADVGVFNLLRYAGGHGPLYDLPLSAKVVSTSLSIMVAWLGHRYWTFTENRRARIRREFVLFVGVCLIGLVISLGCLALSHYVLGLHSALADNLSANVIGLGLATAFRYWAMHKHVFTENRGTGGRAQPPVKQLHKVTQ
jgi:putative flippase GtrA